MIRINTTIATILKILHILIKQTKKAIGKFNDETSNIAITQFVALSYKMYSHNTDDEKSDRTSKGIKKIVIKKIIKMYYSITNKCVIK